MRLEMKRPFLYLSLAEEMNARSLRYFTETKLRAQNLSLSHPAFCFSPSKKMREFFADKKTISASGITLLWSYCWQTLDEHVNVHVSFVLCQFLEYNFYHFFRVFQSHSIFLFLILHLLRKLSSNEFTTQSYRSISRYHRFSLLKISLFFKISIKAEFAFRYLFSDTFSSYSQ